jgi:hypothetical protein
VRARRDADVLRVGAPFHVRLWCWFVCLLCHRLVQENDY